MKTIFMSIVFFIIIVVFLIICYKDSESVRNICGGGIVINDTTNNFNDNNTRVLYNITK